ncbi:hypothetical protein TELCIR_12325, partial [Teladorsagia circumcincta]
KHFVNVQSLRINKQEKLTAKQFSSMLGFDFRAKSIGDPSDQLTLDREPNYSESRVHAQMGVRHLRAELDNLTIFDGEIDCAFADHDTVPMGETILFTTDETILEAIAENDVCLLTEITRAPSVYDITSATELALGLTPQRPVTCEVGRPAEEPQRPISATVADEKDDESSLGKVKSYVFFDFVQDVSIDHPTTARPLTRPMTSSIYGFIFQLQLLSSWGDEFYIGLNGIELYDRRHERIKVRAHNLAAFPESVNILPAVDGDPRTSLNLINGCNDTDRLSRTDVVDTNVTEPVSVDDLIVYSGDVPASTTEKTGILEINFRE